MASEENDEDHENDEFSNQILNLMIDEIHVKCPIDLNLSTMVAVLLPKLIWHHFESPAKKMKLINSGKTIIVSGKWNSNRPYLSGGPLTGKYVFSQLHFHWGKTDMEGSEHSADGAHFPVEMHAVYFKSCFLTQEAALGEEDGILIVVYLFKLQETTNPFIQTIINSIPNVLSPQLSVKLESQPLGYFLPLFTNDYFMYWGYINTKISQHIFLWMISREPIGISSEQVTAFRSVCGTNDKPLYRNNRETHLVQKKVYHVNPSKLLYSTLLPLSIDKTM